MSDRRPPKSIALTIDDLDVVLTRLEIRPGDVLHINSPTQIGEKYLVELHDWASGTFGATGKGVHMICTEGGQEIAARDDEGLAELGLMRIPEPPLEHEDNDNDEPVFILCGKCGRDFSVVVSPGEHLYPCPHCGSEHRWAT